MLWGRLCFLLLLAAFILPVLATLIYAAQSESSWSFTRNNVLAEALQNTLLLMLATTFGASLIGLWQALAVNFSAGKIKKTFHVFACLPLVIPTYVFAMIFMFSCEYDNQLAVFLRSQFGFDISAWSISGEVFPAAGVLAFALAPYSYIMFSLAISNIDARMIWAARSLGAKPIKVLLPMLFPSFLGGASLVAMECLSEFGAVSIFNYQTLSVAIYQSWDSLFSAVSAARLGLITLAIAIILVLLIRIKDRFSSDDKVEISVSAIIPKPFGFCLQLGAIFLFLIGSIIPLIILVIWGLHAIGQYDVNLWELLRNTLILASVSAVFITLFALFICYFSRFNRLRFDSLKGGYGVPGVLIGLAVLLFFSLIKVNYVQHIAFGGLFLGYLIKFFAVAGQPIERSYQSISEKLDWSARSLGFKPVLVFWKIHFPNLQPAIAVAIMLVQAEIMKEMSITLLLRPFSWNTLSTKVFEYTSEGEWDLAAGPALLIVLVSGIIFWFFSTYLKGSRGGTSYS